MSNFSTFSYDDKKDGAITIRTPENAFLLIDSLDRYTLDKSGEYVIGDGIDPNNILINHQKLMGLGQVKRFYVSDISFPWVTPNVNERNNVIMVKDQVTNKYYYRIINEGFYTPQELATQINIDLSGQDGNGWIDATTNLVDSSWNQPWNCTVGPKTLRFFLESDPNGNSWEPVISAETMTQVLQKKYNSNLYDVMNFSFQFTNNGVNDKETEWFGGIPSMAYTKYIDICSKTLTKYQNLKDTLTQQNYNDVVYRLYLDSELGAPLSNSTLFASRPCVSLYRQIKNPKYILWNPNEMLNSIDIQLRDDKGDLLYIPEPEWESNYLITMQMSES
jgi:hypothetical protein